MRLHTCSASFLVAPHDIFCLNLPSSKDWECVRETTASGETTEVWGEASGVDEGVDLCCRTSYSSQVRYQMGSRSLHDSSGTLPLDMGDPVEKSSLQVVAAVSGLLV